MNAIRDRVCRYDPPCKQCHSGSPCGEDGTYCPKYARWFERNRTKSNLAHPVSIDNDDRTEPDTAESAAVGRELAQKIDEQLPIELRVHYLMLLAGAKVTAVDRRRVQRAVADILGQQMPLEA